MTVHHVKANRVSEHSENLVKLSTRQLEIANTPTDPPTFRTSPPTIPPSAPWNTQDPTPTPSPHDSQRRKPTSRVQKGPTATRYTPHVSRDPILPPYKNHAPVPPIDDTPLVSDTEDMVQEVGPDGKYVISL